MSTSTIQHKTPYVAPRYLAEATELLALMTCGQKSGYHVRGAFSMHRKGSYSPIKESLALNYWLPARFLRDRTAGEPDLPRVVEEKRILSAHTVANHLAGKGWVGVAPPSWVSWFALDIDLPKDRAGEHPLSTEEAQRRCDAVLSSVWRAFDFGSERLPVVLRTPGGGYHVYVPLTRAEGAEQHTWPAHVIRERVVAHLRASGLKLRDGELELWPAGKILRLPMGRQMCLLEAQNPDDADYLGLVPVHATWGTRVNSRTKEAEPCLRRKVGPGVRAFLDTFEAARLPLSTWLLDDDADWSEKFGPFGDVAPSLSEENSSLTAKGSSVSQQYEEGGSSSGDHLLKGEFFRRRIAKLLRTGLTVEGGRHDAALKLIYYFGVNMGLGENASVDALGHWLSDFEHVSSYRERHGQRNFKIQTLREGRHYYRNVVARLQLPSGRRGLPLGLPLGEDLAPFVDKFSSPAVEEAALCILRFIKGYADSEGMVRDPVQLTATLLEKLCGERRVSETGPDGRKRRVRATQIAVQQLTDLGILTLYKNYRPNHHGRFFCCWYQYGSGALPCSDTSGRKVLAKVIVPEGELTLVSAGGRLVRAAPALTPGERCDDIPPWVSRMYQRHNFAPGDLGVSLPEKMGFFRDYVVLEKLQRSEEAGERELGTVLAFGDDSGYGFIAPDAGGDDLFVHQTSISLGVERGPDGKPRRASGFRQLRVGERVEFTRAVGPKGGKALWVRSKSPSPPLASNDNVIAMARSSAAQSLPR